MRKKAGFTLIEIIIVVAIIALLAAIAAPSFLRARQRAQNTRFLAAMRAATDAFHMYAVERSSYPADVGPGQIPAGMDSYLGKFPWTSPTPIGGSWDWDYETVGVKAAISALQPAVSEEQRFAIDEMGDDGDPDHGLLRVSPGRVSGVVEE